MFATVVTPQSAAVELQAGAAWCDITPPIGHPMWGYASRRDSPSVGVLDPLRARAVVLDAGSTGLAIVSLDLGRPPTRHATAAIRARVKETGINHVLLCASHTHHGPVLELDDWPDKEKPYTRALESRIVSLILQAAKNSRPARLGIVLREVHFNRNRHTKLAEKPTDAELIVMRIETGEGKTIATLVNFAAHPTMLPRALNKFSADFPGILAKTVEEKAGGVCLFLQGACGDLSPRPVGTGGHVEFGARLADEALSLAKGIRCNVGEPFNVQARERDFRFGKRVDLGNPFLRIAASASFFERLVDFYEREYREGVRPHMCTLLLNEQIGLVGVSGEFFSAHAVGLKKRARLPLLFVGYCNDFQQYFPTIEAAAEGGYGADALTSPVEIGAGEQMMNRALIDLYQMRGRIRLLDY